MSVLGAYGPVVFSVSSDRAMTWQLIQRQGEARFARHEVLETKPRLEFLGPGLDTIDIDVSLAVELGVDPVAELEVLRDIMETGEERVLVVGGRNLGRYCLVSCTEEWTRVAANGLPLAVLVRLSLEEYADGI